VISVLGVFGWVWMVRRVAPLRWPTLAGAAPLEPAPQLPH
jgi:hypothetical protein